MTTTYFYNIILDEIIPDSNITSPAKLRIEVTSTKVKMSSTGDWPGPPEASEPKKVVKVGNNKYSVTWHGHDTREFGYYTDVSINLCKDTYDVTVTSVGKVGGKLEAIKPITIARKSAKPTITYLDPPDNNELLGKGPEYSFVLKGGASDNCGIDYVEVSLDNVEYKKANFLINDWSHWNYNLELEGATTHTVYVRAIDICGNYSAKMISNINTIDTGPPEIEITSPDYSPYKITWVKGGVSVDIAGTASDTTSDVQLVEWRLDDGDWNDATDESASGNWSKWRFTVTELEAGRHDIEVRATDSAGAPPNSDSLIIDVAVAFELENLGFAAYLEDLMTLTRRRVRNISDSADIEKLLLESNFRQPYTKLTDSHYRKIVTRPVTQARIAVEVLRSFLPNNHPFYEYSETAYRLLLANLGTSYAEMRLVRVADSQVRQQLANRLGIDVIYLDQLYISPDQLTEQRLQDIFGLINTTEDPLLLSISQAELLTWQLSNLHSKWLVQDQSDIANADSPAPVIDPDIIGVIDIKNQIHGNTAYDFYINRHQWIDDQRNLIQQARVGGASPRDGFDDAMNLVFAGVDVLALEQSYLDGDDIESVLQSMQLGLAEFFVLIRIMRLADTGVVLDHEWEEFYDILLQVKKLREFSAWAHSEINANLTLEPAFFVLGDSQPEVIAWRSSWRARRNWEKKLEARIKQRDSLKQSHQVAIDSTEAIVLPQLRDRLIATIDRQGYPDVDIADWLTQRLSISFKYSGDQKLTRLEQAVETLQDILLSLRTGRINALTRIPVGVIGVPQWELSVYDNNDDEGEYDELLKYDEYDFDKEWKWMGTYATWRGAMFAFGYPENYLLPTLRDKGEWTKAFTELVKNVRQASRLTPGKAEQLADDYLKTLNKPDDKDGDGIAYDIELTSQLTKEQLRTRREDSKTELEGFVEQGKLILPKDKKHLKEVYFFVPMLLALSLQKKGQFRAALDWFQTVYAYELPLAERKICFGLEAEEALPTEFRRTYSWLLEGLDVFDIANDRANALTRFTLLSIVRCYLSFADAEFTRESNESIPFARRLYITALDLLDLLKVPEPVAHWVFDIDEGATATDVTGNGHDADLTGGQWVAEGWRGGAISFNGNSEYAEVHRAAAMELGKDGNDFSIVLAMNLRSGFTGSWRTLVRKGAADDSYQRTPGMWLSPFDNCIYFTISTNKKFNEGRSSKTEIKLNTWVHIAYVKQGRSLKLYINGQLDEERILSSDSIGFDEPLFIGGDDLYNDTNALFDDVQVFDRALSADAVIALSGIDTFPANPVVNDLKLHAELNLRKLRNARNIAGMERSRTKPVAAELMVVDEELLSPPSNYIRPTAYRYKALIDRAKQLVSIAQQIEANFFAALEKRDAEAYSLLNAQHDVQLTKETVELQDLRILEADSQITLLGLHQDRTHIQLDTYTNWINAGENRYEEDMLKNYEALKDERNLLADWDVAISVANAAVGVASAAYGNKPAAAVASAAAGVAAGYKAVTVKDINALELEAQTNSFNANLERRKDEWRLQSALAQQDIEIALHQILQANLSKHIVEQERAIANMQADHAEAVVEFLNNKFTNIELYEWMSDVLSGVYSYFLQQATAMAQLALNQLSFERQEQPPAFIRGDYWQTPDDTGHQEEQGEIDRRGITGSARLLQDIYQLDQHAFETNKRKLQLVENLSLARLVPYEFQQFRESGVLPFATPMRLFDQGFPGHYLRLIKRVRISIVGLIPPTQGIRASLRAGGVSRVITGDEIYREQEVRRPTEMIAFTSPNNATGIFELQPENELLLPFETMGVDANWELQLPKAANRFNFDNLSDVIFTVEYTALHSADYQQQVIQEMDRTYSADIAYSIKRDFPDLWYHLNQPDMLVDSDSGNIHAEFTIERSHLPPNIDYQTIDHIVLYFVREDGASFEVIVTDLRFEQFQSGNELSYGGAKTIDGVISTRRANASNWMSIIGIQPTGRWTLVFPDTPGFRNRFKSNSITDILFVISYSGDTPEWPEY